MLSAESIGAFERHYSYFEANSFDQVSAWVSQQHGGFRSSPLEAPKPGPVARFARAKLADLSLVSFRWNVAVQNELLEDSDSYFVCLPLIGQMKMQLANNEEIVQTTDRLRIFKRSAGHKIQVTHDYANLSLVIPADTLETSLESKIDGQLSAPLTFDPLIDFNCGAGAPLAGLIAHMLCLFNQNPAALGNRLLQSNIREHLCSVLLHSVPHNYCEVVNTNGERALPRSIKRAEEYMRANCAEPITVKQLAHVAGCSERSLHLAFKAHCDVGPIEMLRNIRLEAAHDDLLRTDCSVTEIAMKWGFSNLGRFASHYAEKYGQLPSQINR